MAEVRIVHCGEELTSGSSIKYLGVVVDKDLKWKEQVSYVRKKCLATLSKLCRIFPALSSINENIAVPMHLYCLIWIFAAVYGTTVVKL